MVVTIVVIIIITIVTFLHKLESACLKKPDLSNELREAQGILQASPHQTFSSTQIPWGSCWNADSHSEACISRNLPGEQMLLVLGPPLGPQPVSDRAGAGASCNGLLTLFPPAVSVTWGALGSLEPGLDGIASKRARPV